MWADEPQGLSWLKSKGAGQGLGCAEAQTSPQTPGASLSSTPLQSPGLPLPRAVLPPVLRAHPSRELRGGSQRSARQLLFSFHTEGHTLQDRGLHPELCIPAAEEGDSGLYWCEAALGGGWVQKQSPQLEVRVWGKGSTGRHSPGAWAVGPPGNVGRGP
ncbi:Fc receptor-like protein 6 [Eubalaena glacialis]|uniref:Fc receptor-like protein 6 n=1 Tax=Eubalaena glacialis TaxID=27606 RepID=UPI002A5A0701|nr:Fc receptor-like protein 6 [Eubalaena glacialis]